MKQRSGSSNRAAQQLSESLHRQLNSYALAATAAGVGMLALAQPAEAKIVYTPTHKVIHDRSYRYKLDLSHDGMADFVIVTEYFCTSSICNYYLRAQSIKRNGVEGTEPARDSFRASALYRGARIGPKRKFQEDDHNLMVRVGRSSTGQTNVSGNWANVENRYLGLRFKIHGKIHYGWARLSVKTSHEQPHITATLTGYAYETVPNKPIIAGKTKGPDVVTIEPATLGRLAQGSSGLAAWRSRRQ